MIYLTRLNGEILAVNADLIELMEETPDTVVTLTTGRKLVVREKTKNIADRIIRVKRAMYSTLKK